MRISLANKLRSMRRSLFELIGNTQYSRTALNNLDTALEKYLDFDNGFFVELGANDGINQSNTYYLEKFRGWKGILIEPVPRLFNAAKNNRTTPMVFNFACVAFDFKESFVEMIDSDLMSLVTGALKDPEAEARHITLSEQIQNITSAHIQVPTRTLTSILQECKVTRINFLSLDVEGYELQVLQGLDLKLYAPDYILVEARFPQEIDGYLLPTYEKVAALTNMDVLYRLK